VPLTLRVSLPRSMEEANSGNRLTHEHTHTLIQPFYGPFSGSTRVNQCQKKSSSGLYGARGDIRGRHTDNPAGRHFIRTNQRPTSLTAHFYARYPSCRNPPILSWLGTGTKYAGLHTQWLGSQWLKNSHYDGGCAMFADHLSRCCVWCRCLTLLRCSSGPSGRCVTSLKSTVSHACIAQFEMNKFCLQIFMFLNKKMPTCTSETITDAACIKLI